MARGSGTVLSRGSNAEPEADAVKGIPRRLDNVATWASSAARRW